MGILGWVVLGLVVGALANLIMPDKATSGIIITILVGIVGAVLGGFIGRVIFDTGLGGFFELRTWILGLIGSLVLLGIWRFVAGRRTQARA